MRFPEYRKPKQTPDVNDGVVENEFAKKKSDSSVGVIQRTSAAARSALVKFLSNANIDEKIDEDRRFFDQISQLVFKGRSDRQDAGQFVRVEYHFSLVGYGDDNPILGELHTRTLMPKYDAQEKKNEHRVERIVWEGDIVFDAKEKYGGI